MMGVNEQTPRNLTSPNQRRGPTTGWCKLRHGECPLQAAEATAYEQDRPLRCRRQMHVCMFRFEALSKDGCPTWAMMGLPHRMPRNAINSA